MKILQLGHVEEILSLPQETEQVSINQSDVLHFLYVNSMVPEENRKLDVSIIRKKYIDLLHNFYNKNDFERARCYIILDNNELKKIKSKA